MTEFLSDIFFLSSLKIYLNLARIKVFFFKIILFNVRSRTFELRDPHSRDEIQLIKLTII